eukprot:2276539-Ditylum_brightwellii.AAC.1
MSVFGVSCCADLFNDHRSLVFEPQVELLDVVSEVAQCCSLNFILEVGHCDLCRWVYSLHHVMPQQQSIVVSFPFEQGLFGEEL